MQNLVGIGNVVLKICEFQCHASLAWKCLFTPLFGEFCGKIGERGSSLQFYPSRNAITWLWHTMNQTASKSLLRFSLGTRAKTEVIKTKSSAIAELVSLCYVSRAMGVRTI